MPIQSPIVVAEGDDVILFASPCEAEQYLEPVDVDSNAYVAYDAQGRSLQIVTDGHTVTLALAEENPNHAHELKEALLRTLRFLGRNPDSDDLDTLLEVARQLLAYHG